MTEGVDTEVAPSGPGCADCEGADPPGWWFHLRRCATCGHVGCCDSSPAQHATAHYRSTGHRYAQSYEPGEDWWFDYAEEAILVGPELAPPTSRPADQPAPGPSERVPPDWMLRLHR
ncbi:ubiquitin-hydrolase Zn-finger-containing protein [Mumia flava]|uniref:Ubiquitin-hydrolase Zn-finger-containing protein n=1 Tax=Mumia flava TaxID=1348852 RepID=A0A0B2B733_9ACTN|nr:UBP-type zinc finger domain-containing protein [Mumia flava]PJJ57824.1 ubiquitin-hydrolase Zn-finger-containing protein [Mumia flava]